MHAHEVLGIAAVEATDKVSFWKPSPVCGPLPPGGAGSGALGEGPDPGQIRRLGLAHVPEDRLATGVSSPADITENLIMGRHRSRL